jgi:hypothetical protein
MSRFMLLIVLVGIALGTIAGCGDKGGGVTKTDPDIRKNRLPPPPNQPRE